ncbi:MULTISPECIES: extracellular solute-binding protein [Paenibacillus]|uniref:extracellular solute-binding protein n=1 Tax=Paenibacillus TaxID=44249 RepID=UPI0022B886D2|nr:extracellular solute-binding protein [Paenibacillus caseinilyticus]MCZ8523011.1 extracellular solute-binding protein [Paenibacillus caseinilyticus]
MSMHTRKRSRAAAGFTILALFATTLTACSEGKSTGAASEKQDSAQQTQALTKLTYWVELFPDAAAIMKSYGEVTAWKEIEAKTGVHMEFQHPAQGQLGEQFNLLVASNKLPDVVDYAWNSYPGGAQKAIRDKKLIPLNDYLDHAPNLKALFDANPEWRKMASTDDGQLIGFPFIREDVTQQVFLGPAIRKDWLDKLKLPSPTTIDEWHTVLKAFKEQDPNGNGKADEIPILIPAGELAFAGAFGTPNDFFQENHTVKYGPIEPGFKEYLATMNKWYKEGLLDKDFSSTDSKIKDAKITGNQVGSTVLFLNGGIGKYMDLKAKSQPEFKIAGTAYPTLNPGEKPEFGYMDNPVTGIFAAISGSNKNVMETVKFLDYLYSEEGKRIMNFGKEGETYTFIDGQPKYTDAILKNPDGLPISQAFRKHIMGATSGPFVQDVRHTQQYTTKPEQKEAMKLWSAPTHKKRMPPVSIAVEDSSRYASIMTDVNTFKDEMVLKFIMGSASLDQFDAYVKALKGLGIEEAIQIQQAALERYNHR